MKHPRRPSETTLVVMQESQPEEYKWTRVEIPKMSDTIEDNNSELLQQVCLLYIKRAIVMGCLDACVYRRRTAASPSKGPITCHVMTTTCPGVLKCGVSKRTKQN